jgi:hypothetical protein
MGKKSGSGSGINNPGHISESLKNYFLGYKKFKFSDVDPGWKILGSGMEKIRFRDGISLIQDPG